MPGGEQDREVVEGGFPFRDSHRPLLRRVVDRQVTQLQCRVAMWVRFALASKLADDNDVTFDGKNGEWLDGMSQVIGEANEQELSNSDLDSDSDSDSQVVTCLAHDATRGSNVATGLIQARTPKRHRRMSAARTGESLPNGNGVEAHICRKTSMAAWWLAGCLLLAAWFGLAPWSLIALRLDAGRTAAANDSGYVLDDDFGATLASSAPSPLAAVKSIDQVQVGERVRAENPTADVDEVV